MRKTALRGAEERTGERETVLDVSREHLEALPRPGRPRETSRQPANLLFHPDGRIQISTDVIEWLWPQSPFPNRVPGSVHLKLLVKWSRDRRQAEKLVLVPAGENEPDALAASPVGRREVRWPVVYVMRAAQIMRHIGIYGYARYRAYRTELLKGGRKIGRAVVVDLTGAPLEGRKDDILACLQEWARQATPGEVVPKGRFMAEIKGIAQRLGVFVSKRELESYVRTHRDELAKAGIVFTLSGKTSFSSVMLEKAVPEKPAKRR